MCVLIKNINKMNFVHKMFRYSFTCYSIVAAMRCILIYMLLYFVEPSLSLIDKEFPYIRNFFLLQNIKNGIIFGCGHHKFLVNLAKDTSRNFLSIHVENLDEPTFENEDHLKTIFKQLLKTTSNFHSGVILFDQCKTTKNVLKIASEMEVFDETHKWLIISDDYNETKSLFNKTSLRYDSDVIFLVKKNSNEKSRMAYDIYNPGKEYGGKNNITLIGLWRNEAKTHIIESTWRSNFRASLIGLRSNLYGLVIPSIISIEYKPPKGGFLRYLSTPNIAHIDSMHRYSYTLFKYMTEMHNFRLKLIRTNNWGAIVNGTWTGLLGAIITRKAEIAITPSQFKSWRFAITDQTAVNWLGRASLLFRHPKSSGLRDNFVKPLTTNVWWCTFAILLCTTVILKFALKQEASTIKFKANDISEEAIDDDSWSYVALIAIAGGFCQQGFPHAPYMPSGRAMTVMILLFTFMVYQFYSASIVSSLLMEPPRTITNFQSLVKSKLKILIEDISYNYDFFQETKNPLALHLYKTVFLPSGLKNIFVSPEIGLQKVEKGGHAFQVDVSLAYKIIRETFREQSICDLTELQLFPPKPIMPLLRKRSPFRQLITNGLRKMEEHGIMKYQKAIWHEKRPKCSIDGASSVQSVTLEETATAFIIMVLSFLLSLFILLIELIINKYHTQLHISN